MGWLKVLTVATALASVVALSAAVRAAASGTLPVNATLITTRESKPEYCPPGTAAGVDCFRYVGDGSIPGLGPVTSTYTKLITAGDAECEVRLLSPVVIQAAGKGTIELTRPQRMCWPLLIPAMLGPFEFTITGGSGRYAGAAGSLTFSSSVFGTRQGVRGASTDVWTGALTVPGVDFDLTPPTISGAVSKTVRAPRRARRVRVRYAVTAQDAVDGSLPVACDPRSGSFFKLGRTTVACTVTDSSANTSRARFTVTVTRRA